MLLYSLIPNENMNPPFVDVLKEFAPADNAKTPPFVAPTGPVDPVEPVGPVGPIVPVGPVPNTEYVGREHPNGAGVSRSVLHSPSHSAFILFNLRKVVY